MLRFEDIIKILNEVKKIGYWTLPIPSLADERLIKFIEDYYNLIDDERNMIAGKINNELSRLLLYFSERMATLSIRKNDQKYIIIGLKALDISMNATDNREVILILSLFYDAAKRLAIDLVKINLKDTLKINQLIYSFVQRKENDKTLDAMGYTFIKDENGEFGYKRTW